jgi:hypothetical protein
MDLFGIGNDSSRSFPIPMAIPIPIPIPTRAAMATSKKNGEATSPSPFRSHSPGDEDIAAPDPFHLGAVSRCAPQRCAPHKSVGECFRRSVSIIQFGPHKDFWSCVGRIKPR